MAFTAQSLVDQVRVLYPGLTNTEVLGYVNRAYKWLLVNSDIKTEPLEISAANETQGYDLSADLLSVDRVLWVTGVDSESSRYVGDELRRIDGDNSRYFQNPSYGTPTGYFFYNKRQANAATADAKAQIWTDIVYNGTPAGGYPLIVIYGTVYRALALTDYVSNAVQFEDALICRGKHLLCLDYFPGEQAEMWKRESREKLTETLESLARREDGNGQTVLPRMSFNRRSAL